MLTSWFNGTSDLSWISRWKNAEVAHDYAAGYALHLIVWSGEGNSKISTPYGTACGRAYPLSAQFLKDMAQLAQIFRGPARSRLYVTLFAEFQTYPCSEDNWSAEPASTAYLMALKDQYLAALKVFQKELAKGKKKIGIFYGAAHMPDFEKRLREDFGLKRDSEQWLTAWDLRER